MHVQGGGEVWDGEIAEVPGGFGAPEGAPDALGVGHVEAGAEGALVVAEVSLGAELTARRVIAGDVADAAAGFEGSVEAGRSPVGRHVGGVEVLRADGGEAAVPAEDDLGDGSGPDFSGHRFEHGGVHAGQLGFLQSPLGVEGVALQIKRQKAGAEVAAIAISEPRAAVASDAEAGHRLGSGPVEISTVDPHVDDPTSVDGIFLINVEPRVPMEAAGEIGPQRVVHADGGYAADSTAGVFESCVVGDVEGHIWLAIGRHSHSHALSPCEAEIREIVVVGGGIVLSGDSGERCPEQFWEAVQLFPILKRAGSLDLRVIVIRCMIFG